MDRELTKGQEAVAAALLAASSFLFFVFFINNIFGDYTEQYDSALPSKSFSGLSTESEFYPDEEEDFGIRLDRLLDEVGADDSVTVQPVPNACGTGEALGCVMSLDANRIQILSSLRYFDDASLKALLSHELGHVVTNKFSPIMEWRYLAVFNNDAEYAADCMAVERVGFTVSDYGYTCSIEQLDSASEIWDWYDSTH